MNYALYNSPLGQIIIAGDEKGVAFLNFTDFLQPDNIWQRNDGFFSDVIIQLDEYFAKKRTKFTFNTQTLATEFQKKVYDIINSIEYGKTMTYTDIAHKIGNKDGVRAVANACGQNKNLIVVPCHRVIRKDLSPCGYSAGLDRKLFLMELEGINL